MINVPVTDNFFLRLNALSNQRDGFIDQLGPAKHDPGEQDHQTARIAALWDINNATRAQLSYDWDKVDNAPGMSIGYSAYAYSLDLFSGKVDKDVIDGEETRDMDAVTGKLWHDFTPELGDKLILSYRDFNTTNRGDMDGTADNTRYLDSDNREDSDIFYSELQFNYVDDSFNIVFGANYNQEAEWNAFYNSAGELTQDKSNGDSDNNFTITADWTPTIPMGTLLVHVDYVYRENSRSSSDSDYFPDLESLPNYFDDEKILNGRIAWSNDDNDWELAVWGRNLTDEEIIVDMRNTTRSSFGTPVAAINQPRSYGIEVAYTY